MTRERDFPYLYVTWLSSLLSGDRSCEWSVWFKAHYQDFDKVPRDFDSARWNQEHTALLNRKRVELEELGHEVYVEAQNKFNLRGSAATLGGKADLVGISDDMVDPWCTVYDAKTGRPKDSDIAQVQIYMWALPLAVPRFKGLEFNGCLVYATHEEHIPASTITSAFIGRVSALIKRLASPDPARKIPAAGECRWCEITSGDCPERIDSAEYTASTNAF